MNDLTIHLRVIKFLSVLRHLITDQLPYVFYHHRVLLQIPGSKQPQSLKTDDHNGIKNDACPWKKTQMPRNFLVCPDTWCFLLRWRFKGDAGNGVMQPTNSVHENYTVGIVRTKFLPGCWIVAGRRCSSTPSWVCGTAATWSGQTASCRERWCRSASGTRWTEGIHGYHSSGTCAAWKPIKRLKFTLQTKLPQ